jgi:prepilin-type N-terminal cleavage/methylation domain-containing protein
MKEYRSAFTLIELLVVISIIAVLAGISIPVYQSVMIAGQQADAMANARGIGLALHMHANDNGGSFPRGENFYEEVIQTSNDAYRSLVPTYIDREETFAVAKSPVGPSADNRVGTAAQILEPGENHWAYVEGLNAGSNSSWPLVVDGTAGNGTYTTVEGDPGGVWAGKKAVLIRVDNSAEVIQLRGTGTERFIPQFDEPQQNALDTAYMGASVRLLEPASL